MTATTGVGVHRKRVEDVRGRTINPMWVLRLAAVLMAAAWAGCNSVPAEKFQETQRDLQFAKERVRSLEQQLTEEQQTTRHLQAQVAALRGSRNPELMDELVTAIRLELVKPSGGYNTDGQPGDDGLELFVQPVDRDGHVIKCAGTLKVKILDPLCSPGRNQVAEYNYDLATTRKMWYGRLMTQHFTIQCKWPPGQIPIHDELIAHVAFADLLTGRVLTAEHSYKIMLPPVIKEATPAEQK